MSAPRSGLLTRVLSGLVLTGVVGFAGAYLAPGALSFAAPVAGDDPLAAPQSLKATTKKNAAGAPEATAGPGVLLKNWQYTDEESSPF